MHLKFKKLHENAQLPIYATAQAAGMDVFACIDDAIVLQAGEAAAIPTGLAMELPIGFEAQFRGRSGLAFKHAVFSFNGTIDADYRGEIKGLLINHSRVPFVITPGMRIGQMVVNAAVVKCWPEFVDEINDTERGEGGFGSTGFAGDPTDINGALARADRHIKAVGEAMDKQFEDEWKKRVGYIPYNEKMGDDPISNEDIMDSLLNHSKGIK